MSKRVIVTGGTGFVGSNLVRRLLEEGYEVHLLVRPGYMAWRIKGVYTSVCLHEVDLADADNLGRVISNVRPDLVFHLAAYGAYSNQRDPRKMVSTNLLGTMNLLEACSAVGYEAFVNTGSSSEYGLKDHAPSETEHLEPNSHYAVTKASATLLCRHTAQRDGTHIPTLRLYSVYGPFEEPARLIPTFILHGLRGDLPPLVNPNIARDFVYIDDVVDAYLLAARPYPRELGPVYNVGTGVQTTLRQVVAKGSEILGISAQPEWGSMPDRDWDTTAWVSDNRKIMGQLGWKAAVTFEDGFMQTVDWFKSNAELTEYYQCQLGIQSFP